MKDKVLHSILELRDLGSNFVYSTNIVNWWLLKYGDLYKSLLKNQDIICEKCNAHKELGLPSDCLLYPSYCVKTKLENVFIKHYEKLDYFTQIFKSEIKCMSAIEVYYMTPVGKENMRNWLINNYELWNENLFDFGVFYLDHDDEMVKLMEFNLSNLIDLDFTIFIKRNNFRNIEEFLDIYRVNFFDKKLYPEKLIPPK